MIDNSPCFPNACIKPMDAEDDCTAVVKKNPTKTPIIGELSLSSAFLNHNSFDRGFNPSPIVFIPMKIKPKPTKTSPKFFFLSSFALIYKSTPNATINGAYFAISNAMI